MSPNLCDRLSRAVTGHELFQNKLTFLYYKNLCLEHLAVELNRSVNPDELVG